MPCSRLHEERSDLPWGTMSDTLTALDATFLELEQLDEGAVMNIGGVMVFDPLPAGGVPTPAAIYARLGERLGRLPRYAQRLSSPHPGDFAWPHWTADDRFDIREHVSHGALPAPGGDAELCDWTADFFSHRLDRTRPLWEIALIEGLQQGRWALGWKTHHCLVDGVGSVDVVDLLLDGEPTPGPTRDLGSVGTNGTSVALPHPPDAVVQAARAGLQAAGAGLHAVTHPRDALEQSRGLADVIVRDELIGAPRTSLNVPIGSTRRFAAVRVPLAELKGIKSELGGTVNDVVLCACASGLRRLLLARGETLPPRGLRAMVPMNLRRPSDEVELGNQVTSIFVDLPIAQEDPLARLGQITASTRKLKASGAGAGASAVLKLAALAPPIALRAALARTRFSTRLFNITITNVPGHQQPLYALGARMREVFPVVPLAAEHAVGVAVYSYDGLVVFGINADCESMPDLGELALGIEHGVEELRELAHVPEASISIGE